MPIYEYECEQCGVRFERLQRMADAVVDRLPGMCSGHVHRVMQPVGIIFKGSGFYVTDNKSRSSTGVPKKKDEEAKPAATSESSATTPTTSSATTPTAGSAKEGESS